MNTLNNSARAGNLYGNPPGALDRDAMIDASRAAFDIDGLMRRWECDREFVIGLILRFQQCARQDLQAIGMAIQSNDRSALARGAHRLVGSASFVGAEPVHEWAVRLEQSAGTSSADAIAEHAQRLTRELGPFLAWSPEGA